MSTHNIPSRNSKKIPIMPPDLALLSTLIRTNFHGPKGVRVIEVRLIYFAKQCLIYFLKTLPIEA